MTSWLRPLLIPLLLAGSMAPAPLLAADDAAAPTITPEQQQCLTWLSLAARFATSEEQRIGFNQNFLSLNRLVSPGTDQVPPPSADAHVNSPQYDQWVMDHDLADDAAKLQMTDALTDRAGACVKLVPAEDKTLPAVH
jgi:hypothetical protein